ncbi:Homeobox-leucine zipper protein HOX19 [Ananas comosus]|uniref:Homeobox-leucine zipper protein HOX19 n=1 Tax=Ananas comosus TaxID=4615 RepID=A0A199UZ11_ANACO|nr:Homeobox-leucine zipper protein HOX19 [Ananas comosus]
MCDTGLALGLGIGGGASTRHRRREKPEKPGMSMSTSTANPAALEPSLTLSLSDDAYGGGPPHPPQPPRVSSPHSTVSSFSAAYPPQGGVKRERVDASAAAAALAPTEEAEVEKVVTSSRGASDAEEEDGGVRKKLRLTKEQSALLEERFKEHSTLNPQKQALAKQLNLRPRQVELKQTEVDCEFLKKCCETLTDENRRLQKELQELRALKFAAAAAPGPLPPPQFYMQFPAAAALTMCPSCERIGGPAAAANDVKKPTAATASFVVAPPRPHFFNPFTHSAAC